MSRICNPHTEAMSYILDALRKAEAQRARGAIPGVHSPAPHLVLDGLSPTTGRPALWWAGGAALLGLVAAGAWYFGHVSGQTDAGTEAAGRAAALKEARANPRPGDSPVAKATNAEPPHGAVTAPNPPMLSPVLAPVVPKSVPQSAPLKQSAAPSANFATSPTTAAAKLTQTAPRAVETRPAATPQWPAPTSPRRDAPAAAVSASTPHATAQPATADAVAAAPSGASVAPTPARPAPPAVPLIDALPSTTQRQLPKLSLGGSIYSDDPAARFLIINGSTFHQGDSVAPDLMLEQIRPHDAVLNFKGQRFRLVF
jgi:general secretion pathway protein B